MLDKNRMIKHIFLFSSIIAVGSSTSYLIAILFSHNGSIGANLFYMSIGLICTGLFLALGEGFIEDVVKGLVLTMVSASLFWLFHGIYGYLFYSITASVSVGIIGNVVFKSLLPNQSLHGSEPQ